MIDKYENFMLFNFYRILLYFKNFNNNQKFPIVSFITSVYKNYFMQLLGYIILLAPIIQNWLIFNFINKIVIYISFNNNIIF